MLCFEGMKKRVGFLREVFCLAEKRGWLDKQLRLRRTTKSHNSGMLFLRCMVLVVGAGDVVGEAITHARSYVFARHLLVRPRGVLGSGPDTERDARVCFVLRRKSGRYLPSLILRRGSILRRVHKTQNFALLLAVWRTERKDVRRAHHEQGIV